MVQSGVEFCKEILPRVSRSFALTIPVLDDELHIPVLINYLQDRLLDNFEDELKDKDISLTKRKQMMNIVVELFNPANNHYLSSAEMVREYASLMPETPLQELTEKAVLVRKAYDNMEVDLQEVSYKWLQEMNKGMQKYLALEIETFNQLDEYCYYVAGTVGGFLTDVVFLLRNVPEHNKEALKNTFKAAGLFLQKVNLVRDIKKDYFKRERVFWPLKSLGITLKQLFVERNKDISLLVLKKMVDNIIGHIPDLLKYYEALPTDLPGYKEFFCINNALGMATVNKMKDNSDIFFGKKEVKVSKIEFLKILQNPEKSFYNWISKFTADRVR